MQKHLHDRHMCLNDKQHRLIKNLLPLGAHDKKPSYKPTVITSKMTPTQRIFQKDEMEQCKTVPSVESWV